MGTVINNINNIVEDPSLQHEKQKFDADALVPASWTDTGSWFHHRWWSWLKIHWTQSASTLTRIQSNRKYSDLVEWEILNTHSGMPSTSGCPQTTTHLLLDKGLLGQQTPAGEARPSPLFPSHSQSWNWENGVHQTTWHLTSPRPRNSSCTSGGTELPLPPCTSTEKV